MDYQPLKVCRKCVQALPFTAFHALRRSPDGYRSICKACRRAQRQQRQDVEPGHKVCKACTEQRPNSAFYPRGDGLRSWCQHCEQGHRAEARADAAQVREGERVAAAAAVVEAGEKACPKCEQTRPLSEFYRSDRALDGHLVACKACTEQRRRLPDPEDEERAARWASRRAVLETKFAAAMGNT